MDFSFQEARLLWLPMSPNQYATLTNRFNFDKSLRPLANGQLTQMLNAAVRAENGSNILSSSQYTTVTANYKKQYPRP